MSENIHIEYYECELCGRIAHKMGIFSLRNKDGSIKYVCTQCIQSLQEGKK